MIHRSGCPGFEEVRVELEKNFTKRGELDAACTIYYQGKKSLISEVDTETLRPMIRGKKIPFAYSQQPKGWLCDSHCPRPFQRTVRP